MSDHALIEAARSGDVDMVNQELGKTSARDTATLGGGLSPVLEALYRGHRAVVERLRGEWRLDLHEAAALGEVGRLREILQSDSAELGRLSGDGWTPLHLAAFMGQAEAAESLLRAGAEVAALSGNYMANSPLHAALAGAQSFGVVEALMRHGANVNLRAAAGVTPLHLAASRGSDRFVDLLLGAGADPSAATDDGKTAADFAAERGHPDLAHRLRGLMPKAS